MQSNQYRVHHSKKRTGCVTCKRRHVKCDEAQPSCLRCQKLDIECGGYGQVEKPTTPRTPRPSSPKALSPNVENGSRALLETNACQMLKEPSISLFDTEKEYQYFSFFSNRIVSEISAYFNPEEWSRLLLQECARDASIRKAGVAIGALGRTYKMAHQLPAFGMEVAQTHHQHALTHYHQAIKSMRAVVSEGKANLRTTLISCIVITCFEAIHGNHDSALFQLQSGISLLQDWKDNHPTGGRHPQGFSSPAPDTVEDFLVQLFGRMEIMTMSSFDTRSKSKHAELRFEGNEIIEMMPEKFESIEQAQVYHDLIIRRLMHFMGSQEPSPTTFSLSEQVQVRKRLPKTEESFFWQDLNTAKPLIPLEHSQNVLGEHDSLAKEIPAWSAAFAPLFANALDPDNHSRVRISVCALQIVALAAHICIHASVFVLESSYDVFLPDFKRVVELAGLLATEQEKDGVGFSFELGVLAPLLLTATKCRDCKIRREAVRLLEIRRREGVWDSVVVEAVGRWVVGLEEDGWDGEGVLKEEKRLRKVGVKFDLVRRKAWMNCLQWDEEGGQWVERKNTHTW